MNTRIARGAVIFLLAVSIVLAGSLELQAQKSTRTITGVVKKYEGSRDRVLTVYIKDPDQGSFLLVRGTEVGKALRKKVGATVRATGYVKKSRSEPDFEYVLDVLEYEVVTPAPPPKQPKK